MMSRISIRSEAVLGVERVKAVLASLKTCSIVVELFDGEPKRRAVGELCPDTDGLGHPKYKIIDLEELVRRGNRLPEGVLSSCYEEPFVLKAFTHSNNVHRARSHDRI